MGPVFRRTSISRAVCGLLVESVRVLSRFVERAKPLVEGKMASVKEACR